MSAWLSFTGKGYVHQLTSPFKTKEYYKSVMVLLSMLTTFFLLVELVSLIIKEWSAAKKNKVIENNLAPHKFHIWKQVANRYKSNFLSSVFNEYLSKAIVLFVYALWMPYFE